MAANNPESWTERAKNIQFNTRAIIDGESISAINGKTWTNLSPIDGRHLGEISACDYLDVDAAVIAAQTIFQKGSWSQENPRNRKRTLLKFADLIRKNSEELALLETLDMGKPISDALKVDVRATVNCFQWHAEAIDKVYGEVAPTSINELGLITREPLGVIAAIVPWNFPMLMASWKLAPALAAGNSVILKPSEKSPLTAIRLGELALEAGIPPGVFNVLPGDGPSVGEPLAKHMNVDGLVFTGSTKVGKHLLSLAGTSNMKRTFVECGGKSPNLVFADCSNLDKAAKATAYAIFYNQGEVCTAASRLLIEESIYEEFMDKVADFASKKFVPNNPLLPDTTMGPLVDTIQAEKVINAIHQAENEGANLVIGGKALESHKNGHYLPPTLFSNVDNSMQLAQEEIFGPVLACIPFKTEEEAIAIANDSIYGLAAGVWTNQLARAHRVSQQLKAGSVWVNYYDAGDMTAPFGGYKQSGNGRDRSLHAMEKYTELKATWINMKE